MPLSRRIILLSLALGVAVLASPAPGRAQGGPPAVPVTTAAPLAKRIIQWDEFTGRLEAIESVEIRARVSGFVEATHFKDGAIVQKGDPLFTIDPSPFLIALEAARAEVGSARAQVSLQDAEVGRASALVASRAGTQSVLDQRRANLNVARAQLQAAQAAVKQAELDVEWSKVTAPISGRISDAKIDVGNLIAGGVAGATLLATLVSLDPIHVAFEASEADYIRYARLFGNGKRDTSRDTAHPVRVRLSDETDWKRTGRMDFIDNQIDPKSGTIRGRALLENKDQFLIPGTFVRLQVFAGEFDTLLVPDAAIASDQTRKIVLVAVEEKGEQPSPSHQAEPVQAKSGGPAAAPAKSYKVQPRVVELGPMAFGLRVVRGGLAPTDQVIIEGLANPFVRPGASVMPQPGKIEAKGES